MQGQLEVVASSDGTEIGTVTAGQGPSLLLVHGGMTSSSAWDALWGHLTGHFRVTAMDRRGRGRSGDNVDYDLSREFDDLLAVAGKLRDQQGAAIDVFGHSYGAVCVLGAADHGAPFRRLVLYEPPGPQTVTVDWATRMTAMIRDGQAGRAMASFLIEIIGLRPEVVAALRDTPVANEAIAIVEATMVREATALLSTDLEAMAAAVAQPVLLLSGEVSPPWATAITASLAHSLPSAHTFLLHGHGHDAIYTAPAEIAVQLRLFLDREGR